MRNRIPQNKTKYCFNTTYNFHQRLLINFIVLKSQRHPNDYFPGNFRWRYAVVEVLFKTKIGMNHDIFQTNVQTSPGRNPAQDPVRIYRILSRMQWD